MTQNHIGRRHDLDWLRVLAFSLLILYHIGMYYVADWGWHIKSEHTSIWLQELMILTNPWRMSLIFFISAVALSLVQQRYGAGKLLLLRSKRILIPLIFGMFVVVAPQVYIEFKDQNLISMDYWSFWREYIDVDTQLLPQRHSEIGLLTWNHLWFLPYVWVYSVIILLLRHPLNRLANSPLLAKIPMPAMMLIAMGGLIAFWYNLAADYPSTHGLFDDWYNHSKYFLVTCVGYLFAQHRHWWSAVISKRYWLLLIACCGYIFIVLDRHQYFVWLAEHYEQSLLVRLFYGVAFSANHWGWIFAVVGLAGHFLNKPSKLLTYANQAVLPWYILHQTLIVVIAWNLRSFGLNSGLECILILLLTTLGCIVGYEMVRRTWLSRILFGLKATQKSGSQANNQPNLAKSL
ncbi:acyltransferase family protein [Aliiglaciecola sp. LCG003]|uniref:acyltransferase family protein n=1 Tax=Aliiglaciecola sp. LCG003 TaxID=3053655 RepID=UPI002573A85F|nr:acyltransferase family protein [Aliiglaciecola sp. LCG003]WJG08103.1 acyltransferase family protein [Aliiglaciecola sp. LCG003]